MRSSINNVQSLWLYQGQELFLLRHLRILSISPNEGTFIYVSHLLTGNGAEKGLNNIQIWDVLIGNSIVSLFLISTTFLLIHSLQTKQGHHPSLNFSLQPYLFIQVSLPWIWTLMSRLRCLLSEISKKTENVINLSIVVCEITYI